MGVRTVLKSLTRRRAEYPATGRRRRPVCRIWVPAPGAALVFMAGDGVRRGNRGRAERNIQHEHLHEESRGYSDCTTLSDRDIERAQRVEQAAWEHK